MANTDNLWAVEWNPKSKTINIQTLKETIEGNLYLITQGDNFVPDYLLVAIANSPEEADEMANLIEEKFK